MANASALPNDVSGSNPDHTTDDVNLLLTQVLNQLNTIVSLFFYYNKILFLQCNLVIINYTTFFSSEKKNVTKPVHSFKFF